jgi:peptidoglycan/LPS O-acetylase OafA/YrhL
VTLASPAPPPGQGYRPDIDGLRALAILPVVAFHVVRGQFPGGFAGVDIFYVISGFLITGLILRQPSRDRFRYADFYARRVRRIFPALIVVLGFSCAMAWLLFPARDLARFGRDLAGSAAFAANFVFWEQRGYFEAQPYTRPLLHLWSLGVEEQFYIVWPLLLGLLSRWPKGPAVGIALLGLLSFALNLHLSATDMSAAFYLPLTRAWELMLGAALALRPSPASKRLAHGLSLAGALLVAAAFLLVREDDFPGWWALLPTLGAALLIGAGPSGWINRRLLSSRPAVAIGLISYPLYLWHWVLICFGWSASFDLLQWPGRAALAALAVPLAWATWRFVERPVRERRLWSALGLAAAMAALGLFGLVLWAAGGVPGRPLPQEAHRSFVASNRNALLDDAESQKRESCGFDLGRSRLAPWCIAPGARGTWLIWGDSHARSIAPGLRANLPPGVGLAQVTTAGCAPQWPTGAAEPKLWLRDCGRSGRLALTLVRRLRPVVVLAQGFRHESQDWEKLAAQLRSIGARDVVLLGPLPRWRRSLLDIAGARYWPDIPPYVGSELDTEALRSDRRLEARLGRSRNLHYVSLIGALCRPDGCRATVPGAPGRLMAIDYGHLSGPGSDYVARAIVAPRLQGMVPIAEARTAD